VADRGAETAAAPEGSPSEPPLVSVIIPTYNRSNVLVYAIRTALAQTYPRLELIVSGDGCTDDTGAVVLGFHDPRVTWLDLPKGFGYGYENRNRALERAGGSLIAYLQTDDLWFPDHLDRVVDAIQKEGADVAYSRPVHVLADGTLFQHPYDVRRPHYREMLLRGDNRIPSSNIVHRRSVVTDVGGWDGRIARNGDIEYWQRMARSGKPFAYVPVPTTLTFTASLRPNAYREREAHEQRAYYEHMTADPRWVNRLRDHLAEDLERRFMDQEVELEARMAVINELDAAVRALRAATSIVPPELSAPPRPPAPSPSLVRRLARLMRGV
jgi:glycosyltransferase involved in cell wall biosynthesis